MPEDTYIENDIQEESSLEKFDPADMPLGTFSAFDVSDQPLWRTAGNDEEHLLNDDQKSAIRAMVEAIGKADSVARRIEVQGAWLLQLLDRGFQRVVPNSNGGWNIFGTTGALANRGPYGASAHGGFYDTNVFGEKTEIIVSCLVREVAEATFFPKHPGNSDDECYADAANRLKHFLADDNKYGKRQGEVARFYCTDETAFAYTRPVADCQHFGYEESIPEVSPEAEDEFGDEAPTESKRPKIRTITEIYGKLSRKCSIIANSMRDMQYFMLAREYDVAAMRAEFPWISDKIVAGDLGIAELQLDRLARQSINLALQSNSGNGDSLLRDCTKTRVWLRPSFYMDDSCPKALRSWFWENFPKGFLVVFAGKELAFIRNEGMDEVLTEFHAHSGNGQNRRALMESYAPLQMRLNVLVDLWDEFCRKEIPRIGLDDSVWNVDKIRASSVRVGTYEPFNSRMLAAGRQASDTMVQFPQPNHLPSLPDFIKWISGPLAEQLTHAMPILAASENNDPETLGQSQLQNENALSTFGEAWHDICDGFANIVTQAVTWNARLQPEESVFDASFPGKGKLTVPVRDLKIGDGVARADGTANFPESWSERAKIWQSLIINAPGNPLIGETIADPRNLTSIKEFMPKGLTLPNLDAVEKQNGEFDVLLKLEPIDNPKYLKLQMIVEQGAQDIQADVAHGLPVDPQKSAALQQAQQFMGSMMPLISSVPVREDKSENHAIEAQICLGMLNSPTGRRLANSKDAHEQKVFQNLYLHWQQHQQMADKLTAQAQKLQPKVSVTIPVDKLPPQEQADALVKAGIEASPDSIAADQQLTPHEITTKEKGVSPTGGEIERTTSVVGKRLN